MLLCGMLVSTAILAKGGGNGGGAHVCQDGSVDMYDLVEGDIRYDLTIEETDLSEQEIIQNAIEKIRKVSPWLAQKIAHEILYVEKNMKLNEKLDLKIVDDANILLTEKGCSYVQLANWDDATGFILTDASIYESEHFGALDRAAFKIHESAYKVARDFGAIDSDDVRRFGAEVFSTSPIKTAIVPNQFSYTIEAELDVKKYSCLDMYKQSLEDRTHRIQINNAVFVTAGSLVGGLLTYGVAIPPVIAASLAINRLGPKMTKEHRVLSLGKGKKFKRIAKDLQSINPNLSLLDVETIFNNGFKSGEFCKNNTLAGPREVKKYMKEKARELLKK